MGRLRAGVVGGGRRRSGEGLRGWKLGAVGVHCAMRTMDEDIAGRLATVGAGEEIS
jgi:hypothetical protein